MPKRHTPPKQLPQELIIFDNKDKHFHESWAHGRGIANFPHPYRALLVGPPNSGKSNLIKNLILHADPPFERAFLLYPGSKGKEDGDFKHKTDEYNDVEGIEGLDTVPPPEFFVKAGDKKSRKTLVIVDDVDLKALSKEERSNLDRLFGTVSTHRNVSIMATAQDWFSTPPVIRRMSNVWIVWKHRDSASMELISRKTGENLEELFLTVARGPYDSITIDNTSRTPMPLRLNIFSKVYTTKKRRR
jgi:hypothetical protein